MIGLAKQEQQLFFTVVPNCFAHKREEKLFFLYCEFRPKKGEEERLGFLYFVSQNSAAEVPPFVSFFPALKPYFVTQNQQPKLGLNTTHMAGHIPPK